MSCNGNCTVCAGCGRELALTEEEISFLGLLSQIPFLPVARKADDPVPVYLEEGDPGEMSLLLQILEKKGLISLDFDRPLKGFSGPTYSLPLKGSIALTQRGQQVVELLEYQGFRREG